MKIFGQIIRTAVNTATLPIAIVKDAVTFGGISTEQRAPYTWQHLEKLKREAEEE